MFYVYLRSKETGDHDLVGLFDTFEQAQIEAVKLMSTHYPGEIKSQGNNSTHCNWFNEDSSPGQLARVMVTDSDYWKAMAEFWSDQFSGEVKLRKQAQSQLPQDNLKMMRGY